MAEAHQRRVGAALQGLRGDKHRAVRDAALAALAVLKGAGGGGGGGGGGGAGGGAGGGGGHKARSPYVVEAAILCSGGCSPTCEP